MLSPATNTACERQIIPAVDKNNNNNLSLSNVPAATTNITLFVQLIHKNGDEGNNRKNYDDDEWGKVGRIVRGLHTTTNFGPAFPKKVRIVEVGPRDGLQNEGDFVPTEKKIEFINRLSQTGLQTIEVTRYALSNLG